MIVRDEAGNLPRSLAPLMPYVDEAVVVDTGSRDHTPELAAELGARVFDFSWQDDFALARNFSLDQARGDWIMWLDGDNRLPAEDAALLKLLVQRDSPAILWATEILEPGGGRLLQKRIFPRRPDIRFQYRVHEQLCHPPGMVQVATPIRIYHWGYENRQLRQAKAQRNLIYLLTDLKDRPDDFYLHYQLARHYFFAGEPVQALVHLRRVLATPDLARQNPEIPRHAWLLAAQCRDRLGDGAGARRELEALLAHYPDYGLAWYHLGLAHFRAGAHAAAVQALGQFLMLGVCHIILDHPEEKLALTALLIQAQALRRLGRTETAGAVLAQAQKIYPEQPGVWLETAAWARARNDQAGARQALETCLHLRPDSRQARKLLKELAA